MAVALVGVVVEVEVVVVGALVVDTVGVAAEVTTPMTSPPVGVPAAAADGVATADNWYMLLVRLASNGEDEEQGEEEGAF